MQTLHALLESIPVTPENPDAGYLIDLVAQLRPRDVENVQRSQDGLRMLIDVLRSRPALAESLRNYLSALLVARNHSFVYAGSGILDNTGFFTELRHRVSNRILPPALDARFLGDLLAEIFVEQDDAVWLAHITPALWQEFMAVLQLEASPPGLQQIRHELAEALLILACRLAALGLEPELVRYYPALAEFESPFLAQQREIEAIVAAQRDPSIEMDALDRAHADVLLDQCGDALVRIRKLSHEAGAAVGLSWHLRRAEQMIARMHVMLRLLDPAQEEARVSDGASFFVELVDAECRRNSVRELVSDVTELLSLQVTEHASRTGEHYVTSSRSEFMGMFRAAAGAGVIVAFMALIKSFIGALHLPPLWEALGFSLNYGLGFVLVHILGFTIATKQPAMTAATLAAALDPRKNGASPLEEMSELIVQVSRSQFIAIVGNVLLAAITSMLIAFAWTAIAGAPPIGSEKAAHLLHDIHPLLSMAIPHAAIAGVCLFLAGLVSGYYDNKAIYHRVPDRLRRVRWLRRLLGERRLDALANYVEHNLGALAGNFSFGFMLGCMGTIGFLTGLPLDIRHVTFGAANFAYAMQALDFHVDWQTVALCSLGVALIALTNLLVSFALALKVALQSRRVRFAESRQLLGLLWRHLRSRPRDFFWPPKTPVV